MNDEQIRSPSQSARIKMLVAGVALLGVFGWFFMGVLDSGVGVMQYYHTLTEFSNARESGRVTADVSNLRLNGFVEEGSIQRDLDAVSIDFIMTDGTTLQPVHIDRLDVSDLFKDGANVVVEGRLATNGVFYADNLLAKCPTKYQAAEDEGQASAAGAVQPSKPEPAL